jgi:ATP-binding cassette subfamily C (CFTR/MRP) protein 1
VPQYISPAVTFGIFVSVARLNHATLDPTRMFTALSLLLLLAEPLFSVFLGLLDFMRALGCIQRIETFLLISKQTEKRRVYKDHTSSKSEQPIAECEITPIVCRETTPRHLDDVCVLVKDGNFGWSEDGPPIIRNINMTLHIGEVVFLLGPVACGKSTFFQALLGKTPFYEGSVSLSCLDIAWCEQSPWLMVRHIKSPYANPQF